MYIFKRWIVINKWKKCCTCLNKALAKVCRENVELKAALEAQNELLQEMQQDACREEKDRDSGEGGV